MTGFGKLLRTVIRHSQLKYMTVAQALNFDVSYISKWTSSDVLPAARNIDAICSLCGKLCAENITEQEAASLRRILGVGDACALSLQISECLKAAYERDLEARRKVQGVPQESRVSTEYSRVDLPKILQQHRKQSDTVQLYVVARLYDLSFDDYIFLMDLEYLLLRLNFTTARIRYFVEEGEGSRPLRGNIALMNLLLIHGLDVEFYSVKARCCGLILCVEDVVLYSAQMMYREKWNLEQITCDRRAVNAMVEYIHWELYPLRIPLVQRLPDICESGVTPQQDLLSLREDLVISGQLNLLLLDEEMLTYLLEHTAGLSPLLRRMIPRKQAIYRNRLERGETVRMLLYRSALEQFVYEGRMVLMGQELSVPLEMRVQILDSILMFMTQHTGLQVKVINQYLVDEIKHSRLPDYMLSRTVGYFYASSLSTTQSVSRIRSNTLLHLVRDTLERIWEEKLIPLRPSCEVFSEYADICNELILLDL